MSLKIHALGKWEIGPLFMKGTHHSVFLTRPGIPPTKYKAYTAVHFKDQTDSKSVWSDVVSYDRANWRWSPLGTGDATMVMLSNPDAELLGLFEPSTNEFGIVSP